MSGPKNLKLLLQEADLYRIQGLFAPSKEKYILALQFIGKNPQISNHAKLMQAIKKRIRRLEKDLAEVEGVIETPDLSEDVNDLIRKLFSFSQTQEAAHMEGAVALAKFGQHEQALTEFEKMMEAGVLPLMAAKNIIRCYISLSSPEAAISQFVKWLSRDLLSKQDLRTMRSFLENILDKEGFKADLPPVDDDAPESGRGGKKEEGYLDISSVSVSLDEGDSNAGSIELEVCFQTGNVISLLISDHEKHVFDAFKLGRRLNDMEYFSPMAVFKGSGTVSGKTQVKQGPKKGNYVLDITMIDDGPEG